MTIDNYKLWLFKHGTKQCDSQTATVACSETRTRMLANRAQAVMSILQNGQSAYTVWYIIINLLQVISYVS